MKKQTVAERVFKILKGNGFPVKAYDEQGQETPIPTDATRFFVSDPNMMITIDSDDIKVSKHSEVEHDVIENATIMLKNLANEAQLNYTIREYGDVIQPKAFSFQTKEHRDKMKNQIAEASLSKLSGYRKTSYQSLGEVKIIYRHRNSVNEDSPVTRVRNIRAITLEHNGEKHHFPCTHVAGARAMARHLNEGGTWDDPVGKYILETSQQYKKLVEFYRYSNRNKSLIEGNEDAVRLVKETIDQIKYDFRKFTAPTTFNDYYAKFSEASLPNEQDGVDQIKDQFTVKSFNERLDDVLPFVNGLLKEKNDYEHSILEVLESGVNLYARPHFTSVIEFSDPAERFAYKLKETAEVLEDESLSNFIGRVSEKIGSKQDLSEFELKVVKEVLQRAQVKEFENSKEQELNESYEDKILKELDKKWSKYTDLRECLSK